MTHGLASTIMTRPEVLVQLPGISLDQALLCVTCDMIYPAVGSGCNTVCPSCTSSSYLKLSGILNRVVEEKEIPSEQICVQGSSHML